jgi:hypothetical protein
MMCDDASWLVRGHTWRRRGCAAARALIPTSWRAFGIRFSEKQSRAAMPSWREA